MRLRLVILLALAACAPAIESPIDTGGLPVDQAAAAQLAPLVRVRVPTPIRAGQTGLVVDVQALGLPAGAQVFLAATPDVFAPGACPPQLRGVCLDIGGPVFRVPGPRTVGTGQLSFTLPSVPAVQYLGFQAVVVAGGQVTKSRVIVVTLEDTLLPDTDGDGIPDIYDEETCDGVDNNGDGFIDEGFPDVDGDGVANCVDAETCDDRDNDGDGLIDEGFDADGDGIPDCFDEETCDGVDNNGDGHVDEGFGDTDGDGVADCVDEEVCDGVDNNGDGQIDEGYDADLDGIPDCADVEGCDGQDNDGDGLIDEGFDPDGDGVTLCQLEACAEGTPDVFVSDFGSRIVTLDLDTDTVTPFVTLPGVAEGLGRLSDGRIVVGIGQDVGLLDAAAGVVVPVATVTWGVYGMAVDGNDVIWVADATDLVQVDPNTGTTTPVVTTSCFPGALLWDNGSLYATCGNQLVTLDVATGLATNVATTGFYNTQGLAPTGDGRIAVFGGAGWMIFDPTTGFLSDDQYLPGLSLWALDATGANPWCGARAFETCNGVDDDGDGFVDEGSSDVDLDGIADCVDVETCDGLDNDGNGQVDEGFDADGNGIADCLQEVCDCVDNDEDGLIDEDCTYDLALQSQALGFHLVYLDGQLLTVGEVVGWYATALSDATVTGGVHTWAIMANEFATVGFRAATFVDGVQTAVTGDGSWQASIGGSSTGFHHGPLPQAGPAFDLTPLGCTDYTTYTPLQATGAAFIWSYAGCTDYDAPVNALVSLFWQEVLVCGPNQAGPGPTMPDEVCDGIDNNTNGYIDEGFDSDQDGIADCADQETCDGVDNDGDGLIDEDVDLDGDGIDDCNPPAPETCNCVDDDGDGQIDEDCTYAVSMRWVPVGDGQSYLDGVPGSTAQGPGAVVEDVWEVRGGEHHFAMEVTTDQPNVAGVQAIVYDWFGGPAAYSGDESWKAWSASSPPPDDWATTGFEAIANVAICAALPETPLNAEGALWIWGGDCANPTPAPTNYFVLDMLICGPQ